MAVNDGYMQGPASPAVVYYMDLLRQAWSELEHGAAAREELDAMAAGLRVGITSLAIWKDGGQFVGVMNRPLRDELEALEEARARLLVSVFQTNAEREVHPDGSLGRGPGPSSDPDTPPGIRLPSPGSQDYGR